MVSIQVFISALYFVTIVSRIKVNKEESLPDGDEEDRYYDPNKYDSPLFNPFMNARQSEILNLRVKM